MGQQSGKGGGAAASAAGVSWTVPSRWKAQGDRPMRVATYTIPVAPGDPEPGECGVFFFGAGQGGDVQSNLTRWTNQFEQPDGKTPAAKTEKKTINGIAVTTISVSGTYLASMGPMAVGQEKKPNFRLLGVVIAAPGGNVFLKLTGPAKTVAAAEPEFQGIVASLKKM
ncbi:MAG: hypothetical protein HY710_05090 [Candidatus Latescibacteria bacterium]|nr:hypothetical protein [Candidatus Latescibacterota bacterium]